MKIMGKKPMPEDEEGRKSTRKGGHKEKKARGSVRKAHRK